MNSPGTANGPGTANSPGTVPGTANGPGTVNSSTRHHEKQTAQETRAGKARLGRYFKFQMGSTQVEVQVRDRFDSGCIIGMGVWLWT